MHTYKADSEQRVAMTLNLNVKYLQSILQIQDKTLFWRLSGRLSPRAEYTAHVTGWVWVVGWWGRGRECGPGQEQLVLSQEKMRMVSLVRDIDTPRKAWGTDCRSSLLGRRISGTIRSAVAIILVSLPVPLLSTLTPSAVCTIRLKPKT